ncbi:MAG: tetratricopeptide repeat protein [Bacteroidales bacterium]|nr:tetratricopeptide repeat protein [Bacteroidales bacterium]
MKGIYKLAYTILLLFSITTTALSQGNQGYRQKLDNAWQFYERAMYPAAMNAVQEVLTSARTKGETEMADAEALKVLCAIKLSYPNIEGLVDDYLDKYPYSSEKETVRLNQASYLFNQQDYLKAEEIMSDINTKSLSPVQNNEFNFMKGYSLMRTGRLTEAETFFNKVIGFTTTSFTNPAKYYLAYLSYMQKDFRKAIDQFSKIEKDPRFAALASYYSMESRFMLKEYEEVIREGERIFHELTGEFKTKTARFLSEAYFATGDSPKANFYFEQFKFSSTDLSRKDIYYSGIIAYSLGNFQQAADAFNQLGTTEDTISQNAQYHLGHSYIQIKNKQSALIAFRNATRYNFDQAIREDAMFNFAKLSFDLNQDINVFKQYLSEYSPSDSKYNEIQNYIATASIINKDYKSAIEALRHIRFPQPKDAVNLQKASLLRGIELIELGAFRESIPILELSISNGNYNDRIRDLARFWLAEAQYRDNQFQKSIDINQSLVSNSRFRQSAEYPIAIFNLAYSYFKNGNFPQAEQWFGRYISQGSSGKLTTEARLRLGDALFMQRKYQAAADIFSTIPSSQIDAYAYANYQLAIAKGLSGENSEKIIALERLLNSSERSNLHPEIIYELGRTLVQTGDYATATKYFTELNLKYKESSYYPKSLLELGLIELNKENHTKAIEYYKQILTVAPQSQEAQDALAGIENIYHERGEAQEFLAYLDQSGLSKSRSISDRESILFSSAERIYLNGNFGGAINSLSTFISTYPSSPKKAQALFYLGDSYSKTGKPELALDSYKKVMEIGEGSFTELATLNYAKISFSLENYKQALEGYSSLVLIARLENNKKEALMGRLTSFFMDKQYENAIAEAERMDKGGLSDFQLREIKYIEAKSYYLTGNRSKAMPILKELTSNKMTKEGAEAAYLIIANHFDNGDFEAVEREAFSFSDSGTPHTYWLAKSFILLGDSYAERENWEQAKATYESILESYKQGEKDDIADQLKMRLDKLNSRG